MKITLALGLFLATQTAAAGDRPDIRTDLNQASVSVNVVNVPYTQMHVCKNQSIPKGWVVTNWYTSTTECAGVPGYNNVLVVTDTSGYPVGPGYTIIICADYNYTKPSNWNFSSTQPTTDNYSVCWPYSTSHPNVQSIYRAY